MQNPAVGIFHSGAICPPLPPPSPHTHIAHFSNGCCFCKYSSSSTSVCSAFIFLSLSSLCECESRLRIKSHLKASPQESLCFMCPVFSRVHQLHHTHRDVGSASSACCHDTTSISWFSVLLSSRHLVFPPCACQHVLTSPCTCMWGKISSLRVGESAHRAHSAQTSFLF